MTPKKFEGLRVNRAELFKAVDRGKMNSYLSAYAQKSLKKEWRLFGSISSMLEFRQIESFYPEHLRPFKRNILREYLQYKMLAVIFGGKSGAKLVFMGGTAIHIAHGLGRFSEDLDFDNQGLSRSGFRLLVQDVSRNLTLEGFTVQTGFHSRGHLARISRSRAFCLRPAFPDTRKRRCW